MTASAPALTPTDVMAAATQTLIAGGYQQVRSASPDWDTGTTRLFEDEYGVVGVAVFATCGELLQGWPDLQGSIVDVISGHVGREEAKAWDGYLVLLTPGIAPSGDAEVEGVRYNTTRLRKLIATGDDLHDAADVERALRSLLPLGQERASPKNESVFELLPKLLATQGIPTETTRVIVDAFLEQAPMVERLHAQGGQK